MAGKVFFSVTMSLDGFMAPEAVPVEDVFSPEGQDDPRVQRWMTKWSELQAWLFPQRWFRENLKLGEGGEEGLDNDIARATYERTGVSVMGKRMFDAGELAWPEEAPFRTPVLVVTHARRDPWERPGGTTFHFVNDGISSALDQAREAAGDRDVRIAGGAETIQEYLDSGLIDEFSITLAPVLFGTGIRLFDRVDPARLALDQTRTDASSRVTHLTSGLAPTASSVAVPACWTSSGASGLRRPGTATAAPWPPGCPGAPPASCPRAGPAGQRRTAPRAPRRHPRGATCAGTDRPRAWSSTPGCPRPATSPAASAARPGSRAAAGPRCGWLPGGPPGRCCGTATCSPPSTPP
jgi:dihydrofolate reductase